MNIIKKKIHIGGMSCVNCQNKIQKELYGSEGILQTKVSYNTGTADIVYDGDVITQEKISYVIKNAGYEVHYRCRDIGTLYCHVWRNQSDTVYSKK